MPFGGSEKSGRFHSKLVYEHVIRPAFEAAKALYSEVAPTQDVGAFRIDEQFVADDLKESIAKHLEDAAIVVADVSGNNANVFFELGFRHALGKPVVCISHRPEDAAFWSSKFQVIDYTLPEAHKLIVAGILSGFHRIKTQTDLALESLKTTIVKERMDDPFQDRVSAWRLLVTESQIKSIQAGEWMCEIKPNSSYMHHLLEGAAALLQKGEIYRSLTNSKCWLPEMYSLLTANLAAAKKGVLIERVFVLTEEELLDAKTNSKGLLRRALDAQIDAAREAVRFTKNDQAFIVKAHIIDDARAQQEFGTFALLCEADGDPSLALEPKSGSDGEFTELRFHFLRGGKNDRRKTDRWMNLLDKASTKGRRLDDVLLDTQRKRSDRSARPD